MTLMLTFPGELKNMRFPVWAGRLSPAIGFSFATPSQCDVVGAPGPALISHAKIGLPIPFVLLSQRQQPPGLFEMGP